MGLLWLCSSYSFAQQKGELLIVKDPQIDSLLQKRLQLLQQKNNQGTNQVTGVVSNKIGYRVQIYYGIDRNTAFAEQAKFASTYPDMGSYISYKEPNYHLKVGDFNTRLEAQRFLEELRPLYRTLFIYRERINPPKLVTEKQF